MSDLSPQNWCALFDNYQVLFVFKCIKKALQTLIVFTLNSSLKDKVLYSPDGSKYPFWASPDSYQEAQKILRTAGGKWL